MWPHTKHTWERAAAAAAEDPPCSGRFTPCVLRYMPQALHMTSPVARSLRHSGVLAVPQLPQVVPGRPPEQLPARAADAAGARPRPALLLRAPGCGVWAADTGQLEGVDSLRKTKQSQTLSIGPQTATPLDAQIRTDPAGSSQAACRLSGGKCSWRGAWWSNAIRSAYEECRREVTAPSDTTLTEHDRSCFSATSASTANSTVSDWPLSSPSAAQQPSVSSSAARRACVSAPSSHAATSPAASNTCGFSPCRQTAWPLC